jgi:hypothetical protein
MQTKATNSESTHLSRVRARKRRTLETICIPFDVRARCPLPLKPARGVDFRPRLVSETEPLVTLRYFGPDVNPEAPAMGTYRKNKFA